MARGFIDWYKAPLDTLLNNPNGTVGRYLALKGKMIEAAAKAQVGVRTGALRASIHMRHKRNTRYQYIEVGSKLKYARMHHEGTRPHLIYPQKRTVLRFYSKGQIVHTHLVRHPGTRPNRYLSDQLKRVL